MAGMFPVSSLQRINGCFVNHMHMGERFHLLFIDSCELDMGGIIGTKPEVRLLKKLLKAFKKFPLKV